MKCSQAIRGMILVCATWLACFGGPSPSMAQNRVGHTVTICSINDPKYPPQTGTLVNYDQKNIIVHTIAGELTFKYADFDFCPCPANQIPSGGRCVAPPPDTAEDKQQSCLRVEEILRKSTDPVILQGRARENECPGLQRALLEKAERLQRENGTEHGPKSPRPPDAKTAVAGPPSYGRPEEAKAMVGRVKDIKKHDLKATIRAINKRAKEFWDRDLYPFIIDFNGTELANGGTPALTGQNVLDLKDDTGQRLVRELIVLAKSLPKGQGGWHPYRWPNPNTYNIEDKRSWVEPLDDNIGLVGVGVYKNPSDNAVRVITGSLNPDDIYLPMVSDMADVLKDHNVRVLPLVTTGGPGQNIEDVHSLDRTEIGLTQTGILNNFLANSKYFRFENKIVYIAKLFNEEVHLVAGNDITSIEQLRGKKVNIGEGSGTSFPMRDIFEGLHIKVEEVSMSQAVALEMVKSGEIAATALVAAKPVRSISGLTATSGLHFVPIPFSQPPGAEYLATSLLTHDDYPNLIPAGQRVETVADSAVLITYDWTKSKDRYPRVAKFVEEFFKNIDELKKPPHHPKWREVDLAAPLPNWTRFEPARNWLDRQRVTPKSGN